MWFCVPLIWENSPCPYVSMKETSPLGQWCSFSLFHLMAHINQLLKFCGAPNLYFLPIWSNERVTILIHSYWTATVVLAAVIFLFDSLREKRSVPLTKQSGSACFKSFCDSLVENRCPRWKALWPCDCFWIWRGQRYLVTTLYSQLSFMNMRSWANYLISLRFICLI